MSIRLIALAFIATLGCADQHSANRDAGNDVDAARGDAGSEVDARAVPDSATDPDASEREDGGPSCLPHPPTEHRSESQACPTERAPGPGSDFEGACSVDADCTEGTNGRCFMGRGWAFCSYDDCFEDGDCSSGACTCRVSAESNGANSCRPGNCSVDADCTTGFCSPTLGSCGDYSGVIGYYCHTCEDECINDADCGGDGGGFGRPYCMYDATLAHWRCSSSHCAG